MLSKIDPCAPTSYKILPTKFPGPYYDHLMQIHENLKTAKNYWFSRDARVINDLLIRIDAALFKMLVILEKNGIQSKFEFSSDKLKSCFRSCGLERTSTKVFRFICCRIRHCFPKLKVFLLFLLFQFLHPLFYQVDRGKKSRHLFFKRRTL